MIILILLNIAIIIYIYLKYYKVPENISSITKEIEDKDSIIIGYINDKGFNNNFDLILAEIVELNIKGYITIEYSKEAMDKYNYTIKQNVTIESQKLNKYEIILLSFLFSKKLEITKAELEEKLKNTFNSYNMQFNEVGKVINNQLIEQGIIDKLKQAELNEKRKKYILLSIILVIIIGIINLINATQASLIYMLIYIFEKVFSNLLLSKANSYTTEGQILKYNIEKYKMKIENKEFFNSKNEMKDIVHNKEFANSLALHIKTQAKKVFIDDTMLKNATKLSKSAMIKVLIGSILLLVITIVVAPIIMSLSPGAIVWVYIIVTIIAACVADITLSKY